MKYHVGIASVLRRYGVGAIVGALCLVLAACAVGPTGPTFRDQTAPIGVTSRYDAARFAGVWHVRGAYPLDGQVIRVERVSEGPAWALVSQSCDPTGDCQAERRLWRVDGGTPGAERLSALAGGTARRAVVLWIDEGFRTAAVGDPSGQFAWVLDRAPRGGADRIRAARQILEFSGFDLSKMEMRP